jgi:hypothetical protein
MGAEMIRYIFWASSRDAIGATIIFQNLGDF